MPDQVRQDIGLHNILCSPAGHPVSEYHSALELKTY